MPLVQEQIVEGLAVINKIHLDRSTPNEVVSNELDSNLLASNPVASKDAGLAAEEDIGSEEGTAIGNPLETLHSFQVSLPGAFGAGHVMASRLQKLADAALSHLSIEYLMPALLGALQEVLATDHATLWLWDDSGENLVECAELGVLPAALQAESGEEQIEEQIRNRDFVQPRRFAGQVAHQGRPLLVEDLAASPWACPLWNAQGLVSLMGLPLLIGDRLIGVVQLASRSPRRFSPEEIALAQWGAERSAHALEHALRFEDIQRSEALKAAMLTASLDGVAVIDARGRVLEFNPAACRIFGHARERAVGQRFHDLLLPPRKRERHWRALQRYMERGTGPLLERRVQIKGMRADGAEFPLELALTPLALPYQTPDEALFMGILRDLSRQKQVEAEAEEAKAEVREAKSEVEQAGTQILEAKAEVQQAHVAAHQAGTIAHEAKAAAQNAQAAAHEAQVVAQQATAHANNCQVEAQITHEQLRALHTHLACAIEDERAHIAREMHDEFGQMLTGLQLSIYGLGDWVDEQWLQAGILPDAGKPSPQRAALWQRTDAVAETIHELHATVRRIATALRPSVLDDLGLEAAIAWQLGEFETKTGLSYELAVSLGDNSRNDHLGSASEPHSMREPQLLLESHSTTPSQQALESQQGFESQQALDPQRATALFRILQEGLTNIARHAAARHVRVELYEEAGNLHLGIHDDGRGIGEGEMTTTKSLGLLGMRERARLMGGDMAIAGAPGEGTSLRVWMPVEEAGLK